MKKHWQDLIHMDDLMEAQQDYWLFIDRLIHSACLSEPEKTQLEGMNHDDMDEELRDMMIYYLLQHQVDRIDAGQNYSMGDIQRKLKQL